MATYTGSCGTNVRWSLDDSIGVLHIEGNGGMSHYTSHFDVPWYSYLSSIKTIIIEDGVTSIGYNNFAGCNVTSITIPDSVTYIGDWAFYGCSNLTSVTIGNSVTRIYDYAFFACHKLTDVYYTGNEEEWNAISIGSSNDKLLNATIHYSDVEECEHTWIDATCTTPKTCQICGATEGQALGHSYYEYVITKEPTCTEQGEKTFTCETCGNICTEIITELGHSFTNYVSNNDATCITYGTKTAKCDRCGITNTVTDTGTLGEHIWDSGVITIQPTVAQNGVKTYTCTVCGATKTESIKKLEGVATGNCGDDIIWTFSDDGTLYITGTGEMKNYKSYTDVPWVNYQSNIVAVNISSGVKNIGDRAFGCCENLQTVSFENNSSLESIGQYSFYKCPITVFNIPSGVKSISDVSFYYCPSLEKITVESNNKFYRSSNDVLYTYDNKTLVHYPSGKSAIFDIPVGVEKIGNYAFATNKKLTTITIPSGVTNIGYASFKNCTALTTITIPASVKTIGIIAFVNCTALKTITFSSGNTVMSIGHGAFSYCTKLTSVNLDVCKELEEIRYYTFCGCSSLNYNDINLPYDDIKVGYKAFYGCTE